MWHLMDKAQRSYQLSDQLIRAISNWQIVGNEGGVRELLDKGADVNGLHGTLLPLHCACMVGDDDCVQLLIERGAVVNTQDGYGRAALHYAAERDEVCTELLLSHGADIDIRDAGEASPLHWAAFKNNTRCVRILLQNGADVNALEINGGTPLSWAAFKGNLESIKILLEYNALIQTVNHKGDSPLARATVIHSAGLGSDKDDACLELLIKASGQFDLRKNNGLLPSNIAADNKLSDMLMPYCSNVRPLSQLCQYAVRLYLGNCYLPNVVPKLPLPQYLQDCLLLQR